MAAFFVRLPDFILALPPEVETVMWKDSVKRLSTIDAKKQMQLIFRDGETTTSASSVAPRSESATTKANGPGPEGVGPGPL
jgi:hypothetical protein